MNFGEKIAQEIAAHQVAIKTLEAQLAAGESWLGKEADAVWAWFGHMFSKPAVTPAVAAVLATTPVPSTPPVAAVPPVA